MKLFPFGSQPHQQGEQGSGAAELQSYPLLGPKEGATPSFCLANPRRTGLQSRLTRGTSGNSPVSLSNQPSTTAGGLDDIFFLKKKKG